jgi:tRNA(Ile)-lysidine synthase
LGTVFLAAVSGGADSIAMLVSLAGIVNKDLLFCLHVNHGLRPPQETNGDAAFVRDFCEKHGINCRVVSFPPGKIASFAKRKGTGIEAAARCFRRKALFKQAALLNAAMPTAGVRILTAHTKNDLLETSLMRFLRGAGPAGLAIMPVNRGRLLRPLLSLTREDVITYLKAKEIPWREDSTNADDKFLRNKIRLRLIPFLSELFPTWSAGVAALAQTQLLAADFIANEAKNRIKWENPSLTSSLFTDEGNFFSQMQIIREEAVFFAVDKLLKGVKNPCPVKRSVVRKFCEGKVKAADLGAVRIRRENGGILLSRAKKEYFECGISRVL